MKRKKNITIPIGWRLYKLRDVCKVNQGLQISIEQRHKISGKDMLPYITIKSLKGCAQLEYIYNANDSVICSKDDILVTRTGSTGQIVTNVHGVFHNNFFKVIFDKKLINRIFFLYYLNQSYLQYQIKRLAGSTTIPDLNHKDFYSFSILIPPLPEQKKIAKILATWDEAIDKTEKLMELKKKLKKGLMQQLLTGRKRFKEFENSEWIKNEFNKLFIISNDKSKQVKKSSYQKKGKYPIVDQGRELIAGYTDKNNLYSDIPIIIFGDHTREIKWIDFLFVIGADGTQLLKTTNLLNLKYAYCLLSFIKLPNLGYSRHIRELKQRIFRYPILLKEQKKIASVLSTADKEIELLTKKVKVLKQQKKGLMQKLLTGKVRVKV